MTENYYYTDYRTSTNNLGAQSTTFQHEYKYETMILLPRQERRKCAYCGVKNGHERNRCEACGAPLE